jgi:hypothetical protein
MLGRFGAAWKVWVFWRPELLVCDRDALRGERTWDSNLVPESNEGALNALCKRGDGNGEWTKSVSRAGLVGSSNEMTGTGGNPLDPGVKYQYLTTIVIPGITSSGLLWGSKERAGKANLARGCAIQKVCEVCVDARLLLFRKRVGK